MQRMTVSAWALALGTCAAHLHGQVITTVAGTTWFFPTVSIPALSAPLGRVGNVAVDPVGNVYASDYDNNIVIRISPDGMAAVVAGNGINGFAGDGGLATSASLNGPIGVAVDSAGNLYIADAFNNRIRKVSGGTITTVAGNGNQGFSGDGGSATSASLFGPGGIAIDSAGNLYIADTVNHRIRKVSKGTITTVAGNGGEGFSGDSGAATSASLDRPGDVAVDSAGNIYIADSLNYRIRRVSGGIITTVAGIGGQGFLSGDGVAATNAFLEGVEGVAVDSAGNFYITSRHRIQRVSGGIIKTVAGNSDAGFSGDGGPAVYASLNSPAGMVFDSAGNLYIADTANHRIRKVSGGMITSVAGNGEGGFRVGDGVPATSASLTFPEGVAVDPAGNLYIADAGNYRIRKVSGGTITTVAGNGTRGYSGDGGPATSASLGAFLGVALDSTGNLYIADVESNRIRKVSSGTITTVAGNGNRGYSGDGGPATSASLSGPSGVAVNSVGDLYITNYYGERLRKVSGGTITTVAGNGNTGFSGDGGTATSASLYYPQGVAVDSIGNLYIADSLNNRIREVYASAVSYQSTPANLSFSAIAGGSAPGAQTINLSSPVAGLSFSASTGATWLTVSPSSGSMPAVLSVTISTTNLAAGTYQGTVTITAANAAPSTTTVSVTLTIQPDTPAALGVDTRSLTFSAIQTSAPLTQQLHVLNTGSGSLSFTATVTAGSGSWLSVSPASGTATPSAPASLTITASPGSFDPGTYSGTVTITGAGSTINISVTLSVSAPTSVILLSQTALTFTAVAQGGLPLPQNFGVLNTGQGSMDWTATATTLSGGNWLQLSPTSGTVQRPSLDVSLVTVSIDPSTLGPGNYYGRIRVSATAANTPQVMTVILTVLPVGANPGPQVFPTDLIFTGVAGVTPGSQDVQVGNPTGQVNSFQSGLIGTGFSFLPTNASVQPGQPTTVRVFPDFSNLEPGSIQQGTITLQFTDGSQNTINVLTVVAPSGSTAAAVASGVSVDRATAERGYRIELGPNAASGCATQPLQVQYRSLQPNFTAVVGQATSLDVRVSDGCGNLVGPGGQNAWVTAYFATESVAMTHIGGGIWQGTWKPLTAGPVVLCVVALLQQGGNLVGGQTAALSGVVSVPTPKDVAPTVTARGVVHAASEQGGVPIAPGGLVTVYGVNLADGVVSVPTPKDVAPTVTARGVVHAASEQGGVPIAPGGLVTVYGVNLADGVGQSNGLPLPEQLSGTQAFLGDKPLPILYTSTGQLNVQVPYTVPVNTQYQLTVQHGVTLSVPQSLVVAAAQPGIFTVNQQGTGQGSIVKSDQVTLAQLGMPGAVGETIVIYGTGLGAVTPAVKEGSPAPTTPPLSTTVNTVTVTVTIGGKAAQVAFAGLTPGYAGLYQVNAVVPVGITTGDAVPVLLSVAGQDSPPVTMAVR